MTAPDNAAVGRRIAAWRVHAGVSQQKLAEHLGYAGRTSISMIEQGKAPLSLTDAYHVAGLFGIDVGTLLEGRPPDDTGRAGLAGHETETTT